MRQKRSRQMFNNGMLTRNPQRYRYRYINMPMEFTYCSWSRIKFQIIQSQKITRHLRIHSTQHHNMNLHFKDKQTPIYTYKRNIGPLTLQHWTTHTLKILRHKFILVHMPNRIIPHSLKTSYVPPFRQYTYFLH